jgi:hypothetical protein
VKCGGADSVLRAETRRCAIDENEREAVLAECLEAFLARRDKGETPLAEEFRERAGDSFDDFVKLLRAELRMDQALQPPPPASLPRAFGEYTLLRELGRGAMGIVFEATHRTLGRQVALKVLRTGFDTDDVARQRFRREARSAAHLRHDNIVEIYDAGEIEGQPYYAMALLRGRSLHDLAQAGEAPNAQDLARGIADIADALDTLHRAGIVHRDVKPSNIMVHPSGRMVLADFGLARMATEKLTATGQALGTPLYMSPEQVMGRTTEVDGRADVYALGATLYEVVTGRPIFEANETVAILRMILKERPVAPSAVCPGVDPELENVILKAVEKRKEDRYQSAAEMRDDLRAYAEGGRVVGRPVSRAEHGARLVARRWPAIAAAVLVLATAGYAWTHRSSALSVRSYPAALALVDGEERGRTPVDLSLSPGEHRLVLRETGFRELDRTLRLDAGGRTSLEPMLAPEDPDDPKTLAALAREFEVAMVDTAEPAGRTRGADGVTIALPLLPRGDVRAADVATWTVEVGPEFETGGRLEFRAGGKVLSSEPFEPATIGVASGPIPAAVTKAIGEGAEVEWGFHPAKGAAVVAKIRASKADVDRKLERIERACGDADDLRRRLDAECLLAARLYASAYAQAAENVAKQPDSARGWVVMVEALRRMDLEKSDLYAKAAEGLAAAPKPQPVRNGRNR